MSIHCCLCLVMELSRLFHQELVMFSLCPGVDKVGNDEWWGNIKKAGLISLDGVGDSRKDKASEGPCLLEGGFSYKRWQVGRSKRATNDSLMVTLCLSWRENKKNMFAKYV